MLQKQMKFQKIVVLLLVILCVALFVYSLGIMTSPYQTLQTAIDPDLDMDDPSQFADAVLFIEMQEYSGLFISFSITIFIISLSLFFSNMQKRRKYYISNFVVTGVVSAVNFAFSIWALINIASYDAKYRAIDFVALEQHYITQNFGPFTQPFFWWASVGYVLVVALVLATVALIFNLIWKLSLMKEEEQLLSNNAVASL